MESISTVYNSEAACVEVKELLCRLSHGDRSVTTRLFTRLWPWVLQHCRRWVGCDEDAQDAAQEVLLKVFRESARIDSTKNGLAWVRSLAYFEALTLRQSRHRRKEERFEDLTWIRGADAAGEDAVLRQEIREALASALRQLSSRDRAVCQDLVQDAPDSKVPADACARKRKQRALKRLEVAWRTSCVS